MSRKQLITCRKPHLTDPILRNPIEAINFSFTSPDAARLVKEAKIHVDLMKIWIFGLKSESNGNLDREEPRIELFFDGEDENPIVWRFTNDKDNEANLHEKTMIDGTILEKCFHTSETVIGSVTTSSELIGHLNLLEMHFRSIFEVDRTDIELEGDEAKEYAKYHGEDGNSKKTVRNLRIHGEISKNDREKVMEKFIQEEEGISET